MRSLSPVSRQSLITAIIEIGGSEATRAPKAGLRLAISETVAAVDLFGGILILVGYQTHAGSLSFSSCSSHSRSCSCTTSGRWKARRVRLIERTSTRILALSVASCSLFRWDQGGVRRTTASQRNEVGKNTGLFVRGSYGAVM
jgi:hypothetical protein